MTEITRARGRLRSALAAAGLATGLFLTACGGDDTAPSPDDTDAVTSQESPSAMPMEDPEEAGDTEETADEPSADDDTGDDNAGDDDMGDESGAGDDSADGTTAPSDQADGATAPSDQGDGTEGPERATGTYREYNEDAVADPGYDTTILFFHASWCPECRAFEESIEQGPIPDGVQILKVDYDSESGLKQEYGVTIQTTFVRVDRNGDALESWVGYEQDRSVETILSELE